MRNKRKIAVLICYLIFLALVAKGSDGWAAFGDPAVSSILPNVDNAGFLKTGL